MLTFNLISEPWIRCADLNGQPREVGLAQALAAGHELSAITDESPLVIAALHRLLLAILHRNFGPRDTEAWGELWRRECFPVDQLEAYWKQWESRFDVFDADYPFYQSATITELDEPRTTAILAFELASGNNATLADHTTDERSPAMSPAEAARALVTHQTFALGGPVGYLKSCEKDADKRAFDAPSARGAMCLLCGANLFQTLMLNLAEYDCSLSAKDLPCWERDHCQGRGERTPDGRVDLFTWQSRRSRLFLNQETNGPVMIDRVKLVPGFHAPSVRWSPFRDESLQSFVLKPEATPDERPWFAYRITPERAVWRDSSAILHGVPNEKKPARTFEWVAQLVSDEELPGDFTFHLGVYGFATDQQKVRIWRHEHLPVAAGLLRDHSCRELLRSALRHAEDTAWALKTACERLAAEILSPAFENGSAAKPDPNRVKELTRSFSAETQYWGSLSVAFYRFLEALAASQRLEPGSAQDAARDATFEDWKRHVRDGALNAFFAGSSGVVKNVRGLRAQALAESELRRRLAAVTRKLLSGDDAAPDAGAKRKASRRKQ